MNRFLPLLTALVLSGILWIPAEDPVNVEPSTDISVEPEAPATSAPLLETFAQRRQALLDTFATTGSEHFQRAGCLFTLGRTAEALVEVNKGLDPLVPGNKINRWMHGGNTGFIAWPGIDCYLRYEKFMDDATRDRYRRIYTTGVFYARLSTSNHKLMAALTRYLATQVWGADAFTADPYFTTKDPYIMGKLKPDQPVWGTRFDAKDPTGEKYLREILSATVRGGPGEFASRPYGAQNILPLLTLADGAKDPIMAAQARIAYEVCLVQFAPAWLRGHLATFAPRSYPDTESQAPWGVATLPWLYFGGVTPTLSHAKAAASGAISDYRLPASIVTAATDRSQPYFYRAFINGFALHHYVNRTYALFSRSAKRGGKPWQGQSYPCGVMFDQDPTKGSHLWITSPAADEAKEMGIHTHGVRATEQEVLGRDSLLFVFKAEGRFPYALGYVPGGYRAVLNDSAKDGRIYLHYGSVLIAVTASQPFTWDPSAGIKAPASPPRAGDSEFRVMAPGCALAIETAPPTEFPGSDPAAQLASFRKQLQGHSTLQFELPTTAARYTNRLGDTVACTFNGVDQVNGKAIDYQAWPTSESPWTSQKTADGPLVVTDGQRIRTYDFTTWTITETTAKGQARPSRAK